MSHDDDLPKAASIYVNVCKGCGSVHINLRDKDGDAFATAILPVNIWLDMVEDVDAELVETFPPEKAKPKTRTQQ